MKGEIGKREEQRWELRLLYFTHLSPSNEKGKAQTTVGKRKYYFPTSIALWTWMKSIAPIETKPGWVLRKGTIFWTDLILQTACLSNSTLSHPNIRLVDIHSSTCAKGELTSPVTWCRGSYPHVRISCLRYQCRRIPLDSRSASMLRSGTIRPSSLEGWGHWGSRRSFRGKPRLGLTLWGQPVKFWGLDHLVVMPIVYRLVKCVRIRGKETYKNLIRGMRQCIKVYKFLDSSR